MFRWSVSIAVLVISPVVDLGWGANILGPMARPVVVLGCDLLRSLGVSADGDTVDEAAHQCQEPKDEEHDA